MKRILIVMALVALIAPLAHAAAGLSINVPLVGRLVGGGNTLYATSLDVTNNTGVRTKVTFFLDGVDVKTQQTVSVVGTISDAGIVPLNSGTFSGYSTQHFDDFVDALVHARLLADTFETDGFLGSVLFVYDSFNKFGQGAVTARFYNAFGGGNVGVALKGHEIVDGEPKVLVANVRDTLTAGGAGATYANLFVNNTGLTPSGTTASGPITIKISATSALTGLAVGTPLQLNVDSGQVANVSRVFQALGVDMTKENDIIVRVEVTAGSAAIEGVVSQVDSVTHDGAAFEMSRGDF